MLRPGRRSRRLGMAAAGALLLAACGSATAPASPLAATAAPTTAPTVTPSRPAASAVAEPAASSSPVAVTGRIEVSASRFALTLPDNWFRVSLSAEEMALLLKAGADAMPDGLPSVLAGQMASTLTSSISLMAFRLGDAGAADGTNVNVIALPNFGMSLDLVEQLNVSQLRMMVDGKIQSSRVTLPAGEAVLLSYTVPLDGEQSAGSFEPILVQYLLVDDTDQLILTFTAFDDIDGLVAEFVSIAETLELLP